MAADSVDPYSTAKANLRDTVKWMATTFAGLAAVPLAGSPFSSFGSLPLWSERHIWASLCLAAGGLLLLAAWWLMVRLLQPDTVYESHLRNDYVAPAKIDANVREIAGVRKEFFDHKSELLPDGVDSLEELSKVVDDRWKKARNPSQTESDKKAALEEWKGYQGNISMIVSYASYVRLQQRVTRYTPAITILGILALLSLAVFGWAANPQKESSDKVVIVQTNPPQPLQPPKPPGKPDAAYPEFPPVLFELGKAEIDDAGLKVIAQAREFLRTQPAAGLLLLAHTDTLGGAGRNRSLARQRGAAVRSVLMREGGIASTRIFVAELPKSDLAQITRDQTPNADNRAVDLVAVRLPLRN